MGPWGWPGVTRSGGSARDDEWWNFYSQNVLEATHIVAFFFNVRTIYVVTRDDFWGVMSTYVVTQGQGVNSRKIPIGYRWTLWNNLMFFLLLRNHNCTADSRCVFIPELYKKNITYFALHSKFPEMTPKNAFSLLCVFIDCIEFFRLLLIITPRSGSSATIFTGLPCTM